MRITRVFFTLSIIVLLLPVFSLAQRSELKPLGGDASLEETRSWLAHSLRKAGTFKYSDLRNSVFDLSFDGCQMSFTIEIGPRNRAHRLSDGEIRFPDEVNVSKGPNGPTGPVTDLGILRGSSFPASFSDRMLIRDSFIFDLKEIDPDLTEERTVFLKGNELKATNLILFSDTLVRVKRKSIKEPQLQRAIIIPLRTEDAEMIKDGFHRAVQLCRADRQ